MLNYSPTRIIGSMRPIFYLLGFLPLFVNAVDDEALFLRRIAEFWEEGEYKIAKNQMEEFIAAYPESPFFDQLCSALGDLFLREKNFSNAVNYYSQIRSEELIEKTFLNRMQCLYELQWHATLVENCEAYIQKHGEQLYPTYFLSLALYQQCLNGGKDLKIAEKALPFFEKLQDTELSRETAPALAHLYCILKDYPKAAQIYSNISLDDPDLLFQAALLQAEYDKSLAIETFGKIAAMGQSKAKEAAYNQMVLLYESGRYEDVAMPADIPEDRLPMARLFLGRSYLALKKYPEAIGELSPFLKDGAPSETLHAALMNLLEAASQLNDLDTLDAALAKIKEFYPQDPQLPQALFSRALILKKNQRVEEAYQVLEPIAQIPQAALELIGMDFQSGNWELCRTRSLQLIQTNPNLEILSSAWRYFVATSAELRNQEQFIADLRALIEQPFLTADEKKEWEFLLAKTYFDLGQCKDVETFCQLGETALTEKNPLIPSEHIRLSLFNAYIERSLFEPAAEHLFEAFAAKAEIKTENLLWLADYYFENQPQRAAILLENLPKDGPIVCKLARIYAKLGRPQDQVALLEKNTFQEREAELLLAEGYAKLGQWEKAEPLFDGIVEASSSMRSYVSASASLQSILRKIAKQEDPEKLAVQLKDLVIQKTLANEPIHLEAALTYVNLLGTSPEKRLQLLQRIKADFEKTDDLLSKDYHDARAKWPEKDQIYQQTMKRIDAEIAQLINE